MRPPAAVIDTNVVVAALLTADVDSPTARILDGKCRGEFPFLLSTALLAVYREVLLRKKIRALHGLSKQEVDSLLTALAANAIVREPPHRDGAPDKNDAHVWSLAESGKNCVLVTGDKLLLEHRPAKSHVMTPREFIHPLAKQRAEGVVRAPPIAQTVNTHRRAGNRQRHRVDRADLQAGTAAAIAQPRNVDVIQPLWTQERQRRKTVNDVLSRLRAGRPLQQFLQDETRDYDRLAALERVAQYADLGSDRNLVAACRSYA